MAVLLVLSIAGIFHRAWHLHSSKHKWGFYRDSGTFPAATPKLDKGQYRKYSPSSFFEASVVNAPL